MKKLNVQMALFSILTISSLNACLEEDETSITTARPLDVSTHTTAELDSAHSKISEARKKLEDVGASSYEYVRLSNENASKDYTYIGRHLVFEFSKDSGTQVLLKTLSDLTQPQYGFQGDTPFYGPLNDRVLEKSRDAFSNTIDDFKAYVAAIDEALALFPQLEKSKRLRTKEGSVSVRPSVQDVKKFKEYRDVRRQSDSILNRMRIQATILKTFLPSSLSEASVLKFQVTESSPLVFKVQEIKPASGELSAVDRTTEIEHLRRRMEREINAIKSDVTPQSYALLQSFFDEVLNQLKSK